MLVVEFETFLLFFQIHGSTRRYNESPCVWNTVHAFHNNVLCRLLFRHGKVLS